MEHEEFKNYGAKGYMEELKLGKFSLSDSERKKIIEDAKAKGTDPEAAVSQAEERMEQATKKLRYDQEIKRQRKADAEAAIKSLEKFMNSKSDHKEQ